MNRGQFNRLLLSLSLVGVFSNAAAGAALPPDLDAVVPPHFTRGKVTVVKCIGNHFGRSTKLVVPFSAEVRETSLSDNTATFSVVPAADAPLGIHPIRVVTDAGVSNLRLIAVSDQPVVAKQEPNDRFEQAQAIDVPTVVHGALDHPARDTETFRFQAKAGERLSIVTQTRSLGLSPDVRISLYDARRKMLATAEGTPSLLEDERIDYTFPTQGEYFLKLHDADYTNVGWTNFYTVKIGPMNFARTVFPLGGRRGEPLSVEATDRDGKKSTLQVRVPTDPNSDSWLLPLDSYPGSLPWPMAAGDYPEALESELPAVTLSGGKASGEAAVGEKSTAWPITINGRIGKPDEQDSFRIAVKPGQKLRAMVDAYYRGSSLDGHLLIYDPLGKQLIAQNNDMHLRGNVDPGVWFEVPAGVTSVVVALRDVFSRGGDEFPYRLTIEPGGPDFMIALGDENFRSLNDKSRLYDHGDTLNIRSGATATMPICIARGPEQAPYNFGPMQGFKGPITVRVVDPPAGITAAPLVIAADQSRGDLVVSAAKASPRRMFELTIVGEATRDDGSVIRHVAERRLFLCEPAFGNMKWNYVSRKVTGIVLDADPGPAGGVQ